MWLRVETLRPDNKDFSAAARDAVGSEEPIAAGGRQKVNP